MLLIFLMPLIFLFIAVLPFWSYSEQWGYEPSYILGVFITVVLIIGTLIALCK